MKKWASFITKKKEFWIGLVLTLSVLWPLFVSPYFSHHDNVQVIRLYEMNKCVQDGQIPCRWVPDLGGIYGYPLFNYYAPLAYYYGEVFYLLTGSFLIAAKIMFATAFVGAYIFMYLLGRKLWGELGGSLSGIFYSFAPYHAVLFYVRGAMGELWGVMFFPAVLWSALRLFEKTSVTNVFLTSIFTALLILSHNLSTLMFFPVAVFFVGVLVVIRSKNILLVLKDKSWRYFLLSLGFGIILSAFYFIPMVVEKNLVHVETTTYGYFSYTEHFKGLKKLFFDQTWGWGASVREVPGGEKDGMSFQIGLIHLLVLVVTVYACFRFRLKDRRSVYVLVFSLLVVSISVFMIHPRSVFVWNLVEPLKYIQFPWRFLGVIMFFISLASGSIFLLNFKYSKIAWWILVLLVVVVNFSYFRPEKFINIKDGDFFQGAEWDKQIKRSIFDFLPKSAKEPPGELAVSRYQILTGDADITRFEEGTNWFNFKADARSHTIIRVSQYYFPNWIIKDNGRELGVEYANNNLGLMTFILGKGQHDIEGKLYDTPVRVFSNWLTMIGVLVVLVVVLLRLRKVRDWINYYLRGIG